MTPAKSKTMQWEQVRKICHDYAMTGLETMAALPREGNTPFRFVYTSGANAERDATKKPWILGDYCLMRVCFTKSPSSATVTFAKTFVLLTQN